MAGLRGFLNTPIADVPAAIRNGQTDAQLEIGFIDVTKAPYSCDKTGVVNCTAGFQQALDDGYVYSFAVWVPKGTYLITNFFMYQINAFNGGSPGKRKWAMQLIGDTFGGNFPTLKAAPNLGTGIFCKWEFRGGDQFAVGRFYNMLMRGFNIDMGNNPNATAIAAASAQWCSVEDINIYGTAFAKGFSDLPGSGGSITNIKITGGTTGIEQNDYRPTPSCQNVELLNQTSEAIKLNGSRGGVGFVGFKIVGSGANYVGARIPTDGSGSHPQKNILLVDGSIDLSGGAQFAVKTARNHTYMRNVYVRAPVIHSSNVTASNLNGNASQWLRVREYYWQSDINGSAVWVDGVNKGNTNLAHNLGVESAAGPPANLATQHGWDAATFPTVFSQTNVDIRSHGAVQSDVDNASATDCAPAINAALAAGISQGRPVLIPRGFWYTRGPVDVPANSVIIGSSFCNCVINSSRTWTPSAPTAIVRTADAVGSITMSDICINGHEPEPTRGLSSHKFITLFHGRTSNLLMRDVHINRREWFDPLDFQEPGVKLSGNCGGRIYHIAADWFHGGINTMHANYRGVMVDGTSKPLAIYQPDLEGQYSALAPQAEIRNSSNVSWYCFKHEPGEQLLHIRDCNNVVVFAGSGNYAGRTMYQVFTSTNYVVTSIARQGDDLGTHGSISFEDGASRHTQDRKWIGLIKKGDPTPFGELDPGNLPVSQSLATGTTASIGAGNLLLLPVLGIRNGLDNDVSGLVWTGGVGDTVLVNGGSNGRSLGTGFDHDDTAGTKSSTATWQNDEATSPAIAAIVVFEAVV